jgi:hypothetical protein
VSDSIVADDAIELVNDAADARRVRRATERLPSVVRARCRDCTRERIAQRVFRLLDMVGHSLIVGALARHATVRRRARAAYDDAALVEIHSPFPAVGRNQLRSRGESVLVSRAGPQPSGGCVMPGDRVVRMPALPKIPRPPRLSVDRRQRTARHIIGRVADIASSEMAVVGPNFTSGFHAASVDLARLKDVLERGVRDFTAKQLDDRWDEVLDWMRRAIRQWVQRYKELRIERSGDGICVRMQTQDDLGYYDYAFDVFPARGSARSRS